MLSHFLRAVPSPSFVGSAVQKTNQATVTFSSSAISGVVAGDLLLLMYSDDFTLLRTTPSGWTSVYNNSGFDGTSTAGLFYKVANSSDTSATLSYTSGSSCCVAIMIAVRDVSYVSNSFSAADTLTCPTVTLSSMGAVVICAHGQDQTGALYTAPSGYTTNFITDTQSGGAGTDTTSAIGIRFNLSGSQSPGSFGGLSASNTMRVSSTVLSYK